MRNCLYRDSLCISWNCDCDGKDCYGRDNSAFRYWFRVSQKIFLKVICIYSRDGKDNHTFNYFYLALGMILSTVKGVIFNLVHLIYIGSCYYKPQCLYRHIRFLSRHTFYLSVTNSKMFYVYYICNHTTYLTLNDTVVAHL